MWEIKFNREEIKEMMKELNEKKAIGPDGVSGYILKQCVDKKWLSQFMI